MGTILTHFQALDILETEARYYMLDEMVESIDQLRQRRAALNSVSRSNLVGSTRTVVVVMHVERDDPDQSPAGGPSWERLYLTGPVEVLRDLFPEFSNSTDRYAERVQLTKHVPTAEALRRFAEQGYTVVSTSVVQWPDLKRYCIEYVLLSKR